MLRSLTLKNFRCFQNLTLEPLERVNLIAGKNNVGKTSLLEAILIFINPIPEALFQVNSVRGISTKTRFENIEELREFLFNQDVNKVIELSGLKDNFQRSLKIRFAELEEAKILRRSLFDDEIELLQAEESRTTQVRPHDTLVFEYQDDTTKKISHIALPVNGGVVGEYYQQDKFPSCIYLTTNPHSPREDAVRYSKLALVKQQDEVLKTLRLLEPRLQNLTVLVEREAMIYGDIGISKLVPLPLMGEGMGRLLSIILAIANAKGGTILIDEIENGLHHSVLTNVWKAIADAARRADAQVFATTHSYESIIAAHHAFETSEKYDFRFHRLERVNDEIQAVTYDRENLATSDQMNLEMR